ncbi:hypothetical protein DB41_IJ00360 [Neochlamydia sp. TUME1]|nr:hypothetical protein DB41_IJ00360 [Neochlamydia sp. TUME1]
MQLSISAGIDGEIQDDIYHLKNLTSRLYAFELVFMPFHIL